MTKVVASCNFETGVSQMKQAIAKMLRRTAKVIGPNEIVPGYDKPTIILANMLAAEVLQHLDVEVEKSGERKIGCMTSFKNESYSFPTFTYKVTFSISDDPYGNFNWRVQNREVILKDDSKINFEPEEWKILRDAMEKRHNLREKKQRIDQEAARQQAAVDAIANIMGVSDKQEGEG